MRHAWFTCGGCSRSFWREDRAKHRQAYRCQRCANRESAKHGRDHPKYNGGLSFSNGRWSIVCRDGSSIPYARGLMEAHLGRTLRTDEHVHHINEDKSDDRIENLELLTPAEHAALHAPRHWAARKERWQHAWSEHYACCTDCGTADRPHCGRGLCTRCYSRQWARQKAAA